MRYLFLLYGPDEPLPGPETPEGQTMIGEWRTATEAMAKAGVLIDCGPLHRRPPPPPSGSATARCCSPTGRPPRSRSSSAATR